LQAFYAALRACRRLEEELPFQGKLRFHAGSCEIVLNDRMVAPNTKETWLALEPEFENFFAGLFPLRDYMLERAGEPRERFRVRVSAPTFIDVRTLLEKFEMACG